MEIQIQKAAFLKGLSLVSSVTSQKSNTLPILANILLETIDEETLRLIGTDLEVGICTRIKACVQKKGSITVPAKKLHEIVRELPEGDVSLTVAKNNSVSIRAGKSYFKIMGMSKEDYPKLPEWKTEDAIEIDQALVKESISLTAFAISNDETRYVLNGVLISIKGNKIKFIATDGRRLAYSEKEFENKTKKDIDMIVPVKAITELGKQLGWDGTLEIIPSQNQVIFNLGGTYFVSRLIEGNFPNYEQVIPKQESTSTSTNREEFLQAVRRTSLLTTPDSPAVKLDFVKGKVLISSRSPNLGEAKEEVSATVEGNDVAIGFNPYYLMDVLKNLDVENISLSLSEPDKPGLIKGKEGYLYVIMPMQLT